MKGGRFGYRRGEHVPRADVREYDVSKPIRGAVVFEDGSSKLLTMARFVCGVERVVDHVELDDETYLRGGDGDRDDAEVHE